MPKTQDLPGVEGPGVSRQSIRALDKASEELRDVRARRMALTEEEAKAAKKVQDLLTKHNLELYTYESDEQDEETEQPKCFDVFLSKTETKVKVRKHKEPETEVAGEDNEDE